MHGTGIKDTAGYHREDMNLSDQTQNWRARALVTGAAGGLGREVAIQLAARGCAVAIADINGAGTAETAQLATKAAARFPDNIALRDWQKSAGSTKAPDFSLRPLHGEGSVTLSQEYKSKPVVLVFVS